METKRKKKCKITKWTVTGETISLPEKKKKLILESPDSDAEGPFRDSDHTGSATENSPHTLQWQTFFNFTAPLEKIAFSKYKHQ